MTTTTIFAAQNAYELAEKPGPWFLTEDQDWTRDPREAVSAESIDGLRALVNARFAGMVHFLHATEVTYRVDTGAIVTSEIVTHDCDLEEFWGDDEYDEPPFDPVMDDEDCRGATDAHGGGER